MLKSNLMKLEQFIIDSSTSIEYPQSPEVLNHHWSCFLLSGQLTYSIKSLSDSEMSQVKSFTFPMILKQNRQAVKSELENFVMLHSDQAINTSIYCSTIDEFGVFWTHETNSFEEILRLKVNQYADMVRDTGSKFLKYFEKYLKNIEDFLFKGNYHICSEYRDFIVSIFWQYEDSEFLNEILFMPLDKQQIKFNEFLVEVNEEIMVKKSIFLKEFPDKVFSKYCLWYLKNFQGNWKKMVEERDLGIEKSFMNGSEQIISELCKGNIKVFDICMCSEVIKAHVLSILIILIPNKLLPQDEKLQELLKLLGGYNYLEDRVKFREVSKLSSILESYWELVNEKTRFFLIVSFAISLIEPKTSYSAAHRELLKVLISHLLYPFPKNNNPLLLFLEYQIPLVSNNYLNNPIVIYTEKKCFSNTQEARKKKSLKLVNIWKKNTAGCLIIVPGSLGNIETFIDTHRILLDRPWNSESFAYKWNPASSIGNNIMAIPEMIFAGAQAYKGNFVAAIRNLIGAVSKVDLDVVKCQAKRAGIRLAECIGQEDYFKKHPVCLLGEDSGCEVIFYCLKELSRQGRSVHDVIFIGGIKKQPNSWRISVEAVTGRIVNCYTKSFNLFDQLSLKTPLKSSKFGSSKIDSYDISGISKDYSKILSLIGY